MLPIPFKNYIPRLFKDDPKTTVLANKVDTYLEAWKSDIIEIERLVRADECPSDYLAELNVLLSAGFKDYDSDLTKRTKILTAIERHKKRSLWVADIKPRIDLITGLSAVIKSWKDVPLDDWILMAGNEDSWFQNANFSVESADSTSEYSFILIGQGSEAYVTGNMYIFPHPLNPSPILPVQTLNQIANEIKADLPAYLRVFLAYGDYVIYMEII